ncbi:MAG: hypothetical protein QM811_26660 [Pirellulales bacterium]
MLFEENAWVDEYVTFDALISTVGLKGRTLTLSATTADGERVAERTLPIDAEQAELRSSLLWRPQRTGDYRLRIRAQAGEEETRTDNNQRTVTVHVRERAIRVLLVAGEPSYDYRFLKELFAREKLVDLRVVLQDADVEFVETDPQGKPISLKSFPQTADELAPYDVVMLIDADPARIGTIGQRLLAEYVKTQGGGLVLVAGSRHWPQKYLGTPLEELIPVDLDRLAWGRPVVDPAQAWRMTPTVAGLSRPQFRIADDPERSAEAWRSRLDPLYRRLDNVVPKPAAQVNVESRSAVDDFVQPLIVERITGAGRVVWHGSDETWRLRSGRDGAYFSRYWLQTLRELARARLFHRERPWRLTTDRRDYRQGEPTEILRDSTIRPRWPRKRSRSSKSLRRTASRSVETCRAGARAERFVPKESCCLPASMRPG